MKKISLEEFEDKLNSMSVDDIIELFPKKIFIINTDYKFGWTEDKVSYSNGPENLISFNYENDFKQALILMAQWLVENQHLNIILRMKQEQQLSLITLSQDKYKKLPWRKAKYEDGDVSFYTTGMTKDDAVNALLKEIQNKIDKFNKLLLSPPIKIIDD